MMIKTISLTGSILIHAAGLTALIIFSKPTHKTEQQCFVVEKYEAPIEENHEAPPLDEVDNLPEQYIAYSENSVINPVQEQDTAYIDENIIKLTTINITYIPKVKDKIKKGLLNGFGDGKSNREGSPSYGNILGTCISARKLGVILDTSPSMKPHIENLEQDIRNGFKNYTIERVDGCELMTVASPTLKSIKNLISKDVDVIYWFCDLQDEQTPKALLAMNKYLEKKNIKLYIKSLDRRPNFYLVQIANRSGGGIL